MSVVSGIMSSNATNNAADKSASAQNYATDKAWEQYQQQRSDFAPYQALGTAAASKLSDFENNGGGNITSDPIYRNQMTAATRQSAQQAAGSGQSTGSGAYQTRLAQLGNDIYNNTYQTKYQQLTDAIKIGEGAAGSVGNAGNAMTSANQRGAENLGNIYTNNANTQSSLYGGMSGSLASGLKYASSGNWWGGSGNGQLYNEAGGNINNVDFGEFE